MKSIKRKIRNRRRVLALKTLMDYAPRVRAATRRELRKLLTRDYIESTVRSEVESQINQARSEMLEKIRRLARLGRQTAKTEIRPGFLLSSFLLAESFAYLSQQREESLHFCTGVRIGPCRTVDTLLPLGLKAASAIGAEAESPEVFRVLSALERTGHPLTGVFHIHPGVGQNANRASSVDEAYMKRLAGRQLVFGIWARDGFLRVLTLPDQQEVHLFGDGVEDLGKDGNERVFRLSKPGQSVLGYGQRPS